MLRALYSTSLAVVELSSSSGAGFVESTVVGQRRHRGLVHEWPSHHPFLCKLNVAVKAEIYRAMGCRDVLIAERYCVCDGDPACGSILEWGA